MAKYAFITGASRGIGEAIARELAACGYHLYLTCHSSSQRLTALANELAGNYDIECTSFTGDIGDVHFVEECFSQVEDLDILINNAGISYVGLLSDMDVDDWNNVIRTNLSSCFYTSRKAIPLMLKKHAGQIINISSVWGNVGASMEVAYSASKGGLNSFTRALAKELGPSNIQVNAIACGVIDTDMNKHLSMADLEILKGEIPADRIGTSIEVAKMVHHIIEAPSYLTGQIITLDGGWQ
ncbi:MAG: SDR family NAD(P)-dependent oxidoreductase [Lachnospiraceae bacterium]|nr:SDR family NAD(P)-dependent oxidoreductase [Lachnospiraceae bacterium]